MSKIDTIVSYLMKLNQIRDRRTAFGEEVEGDELVPIALNGLSSSWQLLSKGHVPMKSFPPIRSYGRNSSRRQEWRLLQGS